MRADNEDDIEDMIQELPAFPYKMPIDGRADAAPGILPVPAVPEPTVGVIEPVDQPIQQQQLPLEHEYVLRRSERIAAARRTDKELIVLFSETDEVRAILRRQLQFRSNWVDEFTSPYGQRCENGL